MGLKKDIRRQIRKMPKYTINQEAFDNQNLARSRAFGPDRGIQMAQEDLETEGAQDIATAADLTDSTSGLLATISAINANQTAGRRALAQDEATIQRENVGDLYQANQAMIDEKDKAFYQNKVAPWEAKLRNMQQRQANRAQIGSTIIGGILSGGGALASGGFFNAKPKA